MAALAFGFTACDDKSDLGIAQENPQEPIVEANGLTLTPSEAHWRLLKSVNAKLLNLSLIHISEPTRPY